MSGLEAEVCRSFLQRERPVLALHVAVQIRATSAAGRSGHPPAPVGTPASYRVAYRAMREALQRVLDACGSPNWPSAAAAEMEHVRAALEMADEAERDRDQKGSPQG
jgi:hypothetical protein